MMQGLFPIAIIYTIFFLCTFYWPFGFFICRVLHKLWPPQDILAQQPARWKMRALRDLCQLAIHFLAAFAILTPILFWPEYKGRVQATSFCATMITGRTIDTHRESLNTFVESLRVQYDMARYAEFYPKDEKVSENTGAVLFGFHGGIPFNAPYCVVQVENDVVRSQTVRFGVGEEEIYCNGDLRYHEDCNHSTTSGQ